MALDFSIAPYTGGDLIDGTWITYRLSFPPHAWLRNAIVGALQTMIIENNWNDVGEYTPDEIASLMVGIWENFIPMTSLIGSVVPFAGETPPEGTLLCNGASLLRASYPALFSVIGTVWGSVDGTHFSLPDLRGRTVVAVGTGSGLTPRTLTDTFGEETHELTVGEMPSHSHTDTGHTHAESIALPNLTTIGLEVPEATALPGTGITGLGYANLSSTGGDGAHNNMQPSVVLNYVIFYA